MRVIQLLSIYTKDGKYLNQFQSTQIIKIKRTSMPRCEEAKLPAQEMLRISLWCSPANHSAETLATKFHQMRGFR